MGKLINVEHEGEWLAVLSGEDQRSVLAVAGEPSAGEGHLSGVDLGHRPLSPA
jgi:hypothetical protein